MACHPLEGQRAKGHGEPRTVMRPFAAGPLLLLSTTTGVRLLGQVDIRLGQNVFLKDAIFLRQISCAGKQ
jgi:hypothetical protein